MEDEKRTWTSLLERDGQESEFDSPEAVVKALIQLRIEFASVTDRVGNVESELTEKDEIIKALDAERTSLKAEIDQVKSSQAPREESGHDHKACKRLERQRALAIKEVEYLRAQLKTFDTEETILMDNQNFDAQRSEQVKQLETLVDQYKSEIQTLHTDLSKVESAPHDEPRGTKRAAESQDRTTRITSNSARYCGRTRTFRSHYRRLPSKPSCWRLSCRLARHN